MKPEEKSRFAALLISLSLIGGTGCITADIIRVERAKNAAREQEEAIAERIARLKATQSDDKPEYMVNLALEYLIPEKSRSTNDVSEALHLLQRASDKEYGPAEYTYGWLLLTGYLDNNYFGNKLVQADPDRGISLLKRAASRSCSYQRPVRFPDQRQVASFISDYYRKHRNETEADLWLARSLLHCQFPYDLRNSNLFGNKNLSGSSQKVELVAWSLLREPNQQSEKLRAELTLEELQIANRRADELRYIVKSSEIQYAKPPSIKTP